MMIRFCIAFMLICMCRQAISNNEIDYLRCTTAKHNATKANLGREFFRHLIHNSNSFNDVNEHNICSLMHFFFQEAAHNGQPVRFSSGMFVLYDPTERFFAQLMRAKISQQHSNEHRSGFVRRICHFALDLIKFIFRILLRRKSSTQSPFIYLRGDESSHFHERGSRHDRWHIYPAYGMDIMHGCMPNKFSHILFGKLKSLPNNTSHHYQGDRIYIKPEQYGLQQFGHYLMHSSHYVRVILHYSLCRLADGFNLQFCRPEGAFQEWIDRRLAKKWTEILSTINTLTLKERREMEDRVFSEGIREIYQQTLLFPLISNVNDFRLELEQRYGYDVRFRKGHEIIFTTEQLLNSWPACDQSFIDTNQECDRMYINTSLL